MLPALEGRKGARAKNASRNGRRMPFRLEAKILFLSRFRLKLLAKRQTSWREGVQSADDALSTDWSCWD